MCTLICMRSHSYRRFWRRWRRVLDRDLSGLIALAANCPGKHFICSHTHRHICTCIHMYIPVFTYMYTYMSMNGQILNNHHDSLAWLDNESTELKRKLDRIQRDMGWNNNSAQTNSVSFGSGNLVSYRQWVVFDELVTTNYGICLCMNCHPLLYSVATTFQRYKSIQDDPIHMTLLVTGYVRLGKLTQHSKPMKNWERKFWWQWSDCTWIWLSIINWDITTILLHLGRFAVKSIDSCVFFHRCIGLCLYVKKQK